MLVPANFSNACLIRAGTIRAGTKSDRQQKYSTRANDKTSIIPAHPHARICGDKSIYASACKSIYASACKSIYASACICSYI